MGGGAAEKTEGGWYQATVLCIGYVIETVFLVSTQNTGTGTIRALPVPEIEALSLTKLHTSGGRRNM